MSERYIDERARSEEADTLLNEAYDGTSFRATLSGIDDFDDPLDFETRRARGEPLKDAFAQDPFHPFDDLPDESTNLLTARAIIVGTFCGGLINASNLYLGLKSGWTSSASIFGTIVGFAVLKSCSRQFKHIPFLGRDFGPRENNIVSTCATAAGGMSNVFVSAFPAMYQLGLLSTPQQDYWRITALTAVGGYFGLFFATPLRKFFIIHVARELQLIFPSTSANAVTIRSMHMAVGGEALAQLKMWALSVAFVFAMSLRVISQYAVGILWDWHIFTWLHVLSGRAFGIFMAFESWGWFIEWTPFIGSGMLMGLNVALSFFAGSVLAWGIIGPILVSRGLAFGIDASGADSESWSGLVNYASLSGEFASAEHPSALYWLLWPGVSCMIAVSLTELACQWRILWLGGRALFAALQAALPNKRASDTIEMSNMRGSPMRKTERNRQPVIQDSAAPWECVPMKMWMPGLFVVLVMTCVVMRVQFDMPVSETCLALLLAFFFSFLAIQCLGATDIMPLTAASKSSQVILGASTKSQGWPMQRSQTLNLLGGAIANLGANQAGDLTADFRIGFLLRTPPRTQWYAQGIGTAFAVFLAPAMYVLFSNAYPCINSLSSERCDFATPSVSAWRAVAVAVTSPTLPIPTSSLYFSIVFSVLGSVLAVVRHSVWTGKREWVRTYHPNMMVLAMAFVLNATVYGTATVIGALLAHRWSKRHGQGFETYGYAVAAGLMAGEGIGGVVNAVLQILGLSGDLWGTVFGCPGGVC